MSGDKKDDKTAADDETDIVARAEEISDDLLDDVDGGFRTTGSRDFSSTTLRVAGAIQRGGLGDSIYGGVVSNTIYAGSSDDLLPNPFGGFSGKSALKR
ncbi:MAG: hypothetical protein AAGC79_02555 [Pseudomonadota bacterium]